MTDQDEFSEGVDHMHRARLASMTRVVHLRNAIRDTIEALQRNSTSAPVVECLKAALAHETDAEITGTHNVLRRLVSEVQYKPGWTLQIIEEDGALRLVLTDWDCKDAYDPSKSFPLSHYHPVPTADYNERTWKRWIYEQCRRTENHEIGEWLRWGDERPFAPLHAPGEDPYTVHEFRDESDARTKQDGSTR